MHLSIFAIAALMSSTTLAMSLMVPRHKYGLHFEPCGSPSPTRENLVQHKLVARQDPRPLDEKIVIDTYFHLIYSKEHSVHDFDKLYEEQLNVINHDFAPANISFNLVDVTKTKQERWSRGEDISALEHAYRTKLHGGSYASLNLYFLSGLYKNSERGTLGQAYEFPTIFDINDYVRSPTNGVKLPGEIFMKMDGIKLDINVMPGAPVINDSSTGEPIPDHNLGNTATHEIGHWLGLYHVFEPGFTEEGLPGNACTGRGDNIEDTPPQAVERRSCNLPIEKYDSCPHQDGFDNVHNYMDYTPDSCRTEFTNGQIQMMRNIWFHMRAVHRKRVSLDAIRDPSNF